MIYGGFFDVDNKELQINDLESRLNLESVWSNPEYANKIATEVNSLKKSVFLIKDLRKKVINNRETLILLENSKCFRY